MSDRIENEKVIEEKAKQKEEIEKAVKPEHYHAGGIDVFRYASANFMIVQNLGYHQITAIKYMSRAGKKDAVLKDLHKAKAHIQKAIDIATKAGPDQMKAIERMIRNSQN